MLVNTLKMNNKHILQEQMLLSHIKRKIFPSYKVKKILLNQEHICIFEMHLCDVDHN